MPLVTFSPKGLYSSYAFLSNEIKMDIKQKIKDRKKEKQQIKHIREKERHRQTLLTARYKEQARGRKARKRADFDFWQTLHRDLSTPRKRKDVRKNIDKMIFGGK